MLIILGIAWSCKKTGDPASNTEETPPIEQVIVSKNITTGTFTEVSNTTVGPSGATVKIAKPGTPIDGTEIIIPANAFTTNPALKISYAEIKNHQFGANFNPISPIISISCDGGYSSELMSITIPVKIPAGHIPLGFYIDETTGKLEGIPFNSITSNSITLLTRHFLPSSKLKSGAINLKSVLSTGANIVISSIAESSLNAPPLITTGFKPGVDDWEFVNYGSYLAPGGHCAGQNMTAMWYYFEKKASNGSLFNKFSDNAKLWQDNARGYRFCSVIHRDLDWDGKVATLFYKYIDKNQDLDKLKLLTIAGTMLVTAEPQGIGVYYQNGVKADGSPKYSGHDLICYQISVSGGKLYISDPNTPGTEQTISFANNKFSPYIAKLNGNEPATPFPYVTYYAKTAYIEWDKIGKRYGEIFDNTIGTIAPNTFPPYTIWVKDIIKDLELKDGLNVTNDTLKTYVDCPTSISGVVQNGKRLISMNVFGEDGLIKSKQIGPVVTNWGLSIGNNVKLAPGSNKLGYEIIGWNPSAHYANSTENIPLFIDFKWINVYYTKLEISPNPIISMPGKEIALTAKSFGSAPKNAKYVWNFGDGTADVSVTNDSIVKYKYSKTGNFNVVLNLYDNATNKLMGTATTVAKINQLITKFALYFSVDCHLKITSPNGSISTGPDVAQSLNLKEIPCVQNGDVINASWDGSYSGYYHKGTATFTLKSNNTVTFTISDIYTNPGAYTQTWNATSKDIPFISDNTAFRYLTYGVPSSFSVLQTANFKTDYTISKSGIYESTGIFYDPNNLVKTLLEVKFTY